MEQSRLHIPILFAFDTIHGYRTVFPIPLGEASSFDPSVATTDDTIAARETATVGIKQIYSPMVDVSHEARWGRIAEGAGEDPYLGSVFAAARVKAAQGTDYSAPDKVVTSPKHFAAYGQPEGGREYNTTDMSEQRLWNMYLPPFKAAIDAGADTVMCSFNAINGVPGCANHETETDILKQEWHFDGFVESDYTAVDELIRHGDRGQRRRRRREAALNAGTDMEMVSTDIRDNARAAARRAPDLDGADRRRGEADPARQVPRRALRPPVRRPGEGHAIRASFVTPADRAAERAAASKSMVLLKNDGEHAAARSDEVGRRDRPARQRPARHARPVVGRRPRLGRGLALHRDQGAGSEHDVHAGLHDRGQGPAGQHPGRRVPLGPASPAVAAARTRPTRSCSRSASAACMSGEAESRTTLDLPGKQQEIIDAVAATGKPFVVVLFNGRPLTLTDVAAKSPAILEAWFPGIEAGNAVADVLFGKVNPGGKLPVSFPRVLGQVPIYYNHEPTGRPCDSTFKWNSRYRDLPNCDPLYPFGFGLSYTTFSVTNLHLDKDDRVEERRGHRDGRRDQHRETAPATTSCSSTSTTRSRASRSRCAACAASSG